MKKVKIFPIRIGIMLMFVCALTIAAKAASFTVNSTSDTNDVNTSDNMCADASGNCSLRAAIEQANALAGPDAIVFDAALFAAPQTILLGSSALPQITDDLTITGTGSPALLVVSGRENNRIFNIASATTVGISNLTVADGYVGEASGGGIFNAGDLTLTNVIVRNNVVSLGTGAGIYNNNTGNLTVMNSAIYQNDAQNFFGAGGGIANSGGTVSITNSIVRDNLASGVIDANGGGILSDEGTVTLTESTVSGNSANGDGGGIAVFNGTLNVVRSTIGSSTQRGSNSATDGAGIFSAQSKVTLTNSTISGNVAANVGGGFFSVANTAPTTLNCNSSTIAFNTAATGGGIAIGYQPAKRSRAPQAKAGVISAVTLSNTIVSDNIATTAPDISDDSGFSGTFTSNGYNIIENTSGATVTPNTGDQFGVDPLLLPLANNGGATETHALSNTPGARSPAIDKGSSGETTDQRGFTRPVDIVFIAPAEFGNNSDIGAFEVQSATAAPVFIKGRVINETGRAVSKASVILIENDGTRRFAMTNPFGYFRFDNITTGQTVTITLNSKKARFSPFVVTVNDNIEELNLTAQP